MNARATRWGAYKRITEAVRARITEGEFAPGEAIPSEVMLCAEYGVARNTLRRALDRLSEEGMIVVMPGRGRVVAPAAGTVASVVPQYRALAAELRSMIESGQLRPGDPLPSESALVEQHGVARGTVRHALAELEGAGLVESVHGKGRYVRQS